MNENTVIKRASLTGILCNIAMSLGKLVLGIISNSISLISDGLNNLTDIGNSLITYIGYFITNKPADSDHPYGHGRAEYITSQIISFMIMYVGVDLLKESVTRLIHPVEVSYNQYTLYVLLASILIKIALGYYYGQLYQQTRITTLKATSADSYSDSVITSVTLIGYLFRNVSSSIDSLIGIGIAVVVIYNGIRIFLDMSSLLLSEPVSRETLETIRHIIDRHDEVSDPHDFRFHSYGRNNNYGSGDVQVDGKLSFDDAHRILDSIEREIFMETGIEFTIHGDPASRGPVYDILKVALNKMTDDNRIISYHDLTVDEARQLIQVDVVMKYGSSDNGIIQQYLTDYCKLSGLDYKVEVRTDHQ